MVIPALLLLLAFWALVWRFSSELEGYGFRVRPGVLMWHTKRGLRFIDRVAKASKRGWLAFGTAGAIIGVCSMVFVFVGITINAVIALTRPVEAVGGVRPVLPGMIPSLSVLSWLIAIASLLLVHELAHGFLLRAQGLETKSVGGILAVIIPGAFVEPDEKQLMEAPVSKRLRVFGAGSFANFLLAALCLGIILLSLTPLRGLHIDRVVEGSPADNAGLREGMRLLRLDNTQIERVWEFHNFMRNTKPRQEIFVSTDMENFLIELAPHPDNENVGYLGIRPHWTAGVPASSFANPLTVMEVMLYELMGRPIFHPHAYHSSIVPWEVIDAVRWTFVLNLGIGLFNLLPAIPLDGGYMMQGVVERVTSERTAKRVTRGLSLLVLALIIANFMPALLRGIG